VSRILSPASNCADTECPYYGNGSSGYFPECDTSQLDAYYVTARNGAGGESPRSNLVFWRCNGPVGYARVVTGEDPTDALASMEGTAPGEALACWNTDGPSLEDFVAPPPPSRLAMAPMVRLGAVADPPWEFLGLHTDHLGSVRLVTDGSGAVVSVHNYFPFGEEIAPMFSHNTHQYTGHERDRDTGLDYMLARYYEAGVGRFISSDSGVDSRLDVPQSWNRFAYVRNNPMSATDPQGLAVQPFNEAFDYIRDTLSDELGAALRLDLDGFIDADSLPAISSINENFNDLKELVGSANIVDVFGSDVPVIAGPPVQYMETFWYNGPDDNFLGEFAPPDSSLGAQASPTNHYTVSLFNSPAVPAEAMQSTTAHELYGHALLCLRGAPYEHNEPSADARFSAVQHRPTKSSMAGPWVQASKGRNPVPGHHTKTTIGGVSQDDVLTGQ